MPHFIVLKLTGGPMDGAEYTLSADPADTVTARLPDGLLFSGFDDQHRPTQHHYRFTARHRVSLDDDWQGVAICYDFHETLVDVTDDEPADEEE